ncbi:cation:proton antiporter [Thermosipho melanesiensis]|uniref:Na+/H+ antiporter MnhB subunit-related protein n=2 Tax=Thermosipho melanesiensis TaxID=46541 RepID=A6LMB7_THEM4|nr:Na(+)/H(+) antiporter subunit B [Thermosipho melanesiensis]ABR31068.1 Na+/H+ antiporter MnhB subunit-related protein [Thermosipho melanesiensis BI429]APT74162.1 cation:proton antiporter [Thermosipho melanesiensis]OOC36108.1 cation:proton antiporter [Thermosipho melanesiensis]OOC36925.1 cation:proton antiporter [Thermosipho melanesiensis]OOC37676.1 cation:proton antiporter [Thermosipho melanesiensis]
MRRVFSLLIVTGLLIFFVSSLSAIPEYGKARLSKVSKAYINKNVKGETGEVEFEKSKNLEDGAANVVTSIVVDYRSFDTLGEVTVLFTSALGVGIILNGIKKKTFGRTPNFILRISVGILLPLILLFGAYIFIHGHLTPGGGFPGGTIIAAGILLLYLSNEEFKLGKASKFVESVAGSVYVIIGIIGLAIGGYFLINFLPTGVLGALFSAGIIPIVYVVIGFKVGAELSGIIADLHGEG